MPLTDKKLKSMLEIVNNKFPNWTGFDDPRFIEEETRYKRDASKKAKELLSKEVLSELLYKGDYDDFLKRIEKVGQSTNLLYLSTPKSGDLSIIYQESLNKEGFCKVFFNLLYGEKDLKLRFKNYLHYIRENKLPNKFTFPTYFLFLLFPESEIFIKPTIVNKYGKLLDERNFDIKIPYFPSYGMIRQSMLTLKEMLREYNPKDIIDIQSFIWVAVKSGVEDVDNENLLSVIKKAKLFNFEDADLNREINGRELFVQRFPIENFRNMTLEDYADAENSDSFCYWLEFKKEIPMGIGGGNASKFGIYKSKEGKYYKGTRNSKILLDGDELEKEFTELKSKLLHCFDLIKNDKIIELRNIDVAIWNMVLIKIFWLYFPDKFIDIGAPEWLIKIAKMIELKTNYDINDKQNAILLNYDIKHYLKNIEPFKKWNEYQFGIFFWKNFVLNGKEKIIINDNQPQYWLLAPGQKAKAWQDFQDNNIIAIGWDKLGDFLGDLSKYNSLEDIKMKMKEMYGDDSSYVNDGLACFEFVTKINIGDYVFIKTGRKKILGFGQVLSDYYYDNTRKEYLNCRKVKWIKIGDWKCQEKLALKTLTNITKYPEMVDDLKKLIEPETTTLATNYWWLNSNPKIWTFRDMNIGAINDYKSFTDKGTKARIFKNFQNVQVNDKIIGYITSPENIIDGICEVTDIFKENSEIVKFEFKKIEEFKNPVSWHELKSINELLNCEPMKNNQGSLFKLTKEEYDIIMDMVYIKNHPVPENGIYTIDDALTELFIEQSELEKIISTLKYKKNIILQGAPGVGKTFIAKRIAYLMMGEKDESRVQMIQFHQSYSYEDFIQGYRPTDNGGFEIKNGVFYEFCKKAQWDRDNDYFFIIDEINRGNLSKIFGELMMLIEKDKRGKNFAIPLTYSKNEDEKFYLPENLYFIGTMNTADRSLAMVDYALRRRFGFITLEPAFDKPKFKKFLFNCNVPENIVEKIIDKMISLNEKISIDNKNLGAGYRIGHSFFCPGKDIVPDWRWYEEVIKSEIEPLLREYWFDSIELVDDEVKKLVQI